MNKFSLYDEIYECEQRLRRACNQIIQLNARLDGLHRRYVIAKDQNDKCFRMSLRNRILVTEGMLTAYCNYAHNKKDEVINLRHELYPTGNDVRNRAQTDVDTEESDVEMTDE